MEAASIPASGARSLSANGRRRWSATRGMSFGFTAVAVGFLLLLLGLFFWQSLPIWHHAGLSHLTGIKWFYRQQQFGMAPMIYGTVAVSGVALLLAAPVGLGAAIFTSEFLPRRLRSAVKVTIELLAGIPS